MPLLDSVSVSFPFVMQNIFAGDNCACIHRFIIAALFKFDIWSLFEGREGGEGNFRCKIEF